MGEKTSFFHNGGIIELLLKVKIRDEGCVKSKAVHLGMGILPNDAHIWGLWIEHAVLTPSPF